MKSRYKVISESGRYWRSRDEIIENVQSATILQHTGLGIEELHMRRAEARRATTFKDMIRGLAAPECGENRPVKRTCLQPQSFRVAPAPNDRPHVGVPERDSHGFSTQSLTQTCVSAVHEKDGLATSHDMLHSFAFGFSRGIMQLHAQLRSTTRNCIAATAAGSSRWLVWTEATPIRYMSELIGSDYENTGD